MSKADSPLDVLLFAGPFEVRGTSAYTLRLAQYTAAYGIAARVVCPNATKVGPGLRSKLDIKEYRHLNVPMLGHLLLHFVKKELENKRPDLIHIQSRDVLEPGQWLACNL